MTKLTDSQLLILSRAAQRDDHAVEPPPNLNGAAAQKAFKKLLNLLLAETRGAPEMPIWRRDEDGRPVALVITSAGLEAIGVTPADEQQESEPSIPLPATEDAGPGQDSDVAVEIGAPLEKTPRVGTKLTAVLQLLQRESGATIDDLVAATGWLPHTARAALTGLRKRGYRIETERGEDRKTIYRIAGPATGGRGQHAGTAAEGEA